jgi:hypothetical protein
VLIYDQGAKFLSLYSCAGDGGSFQLFNFQKSNGEISSLTTTKVPGHEDWIHALVFKALLLMLL